MQILQVSFMQIMYYLCEVQCFVLSPERKWFIKNTFCSSSPFNSCEYVSVALVYIIYGAFNMCVVKCLLIHLTLAIYNKSVIATYKMFFFATYMIFFALYTVFFAPYKMYFCNIYSYEVVLQHTVQYNTPHNTVFCIIYCTMLFTTLKTFLKYLFSIHYA